MSIVSSTLTAFSPSLGRLPIDKDYKITMGGIEREEVDGSTGQLGYKETFKSPGLMVKVADVAALSKIKLANIVDEPFTIMKNNGETLTLNNAFQKNIIEVGQDGMIELMFSGSEFIEA